MSDNTNCVVLSVAEEALKTGDANSDWGDNFTADKAKLSYLQSIAYSLLAIAHSLEKKS